MSEATHRSFSGEAAGGLERGGVSCWVSGAGVFLGGEARRESAEEDRSEGDGLVAQGGGIAGEARLGSRCIPIQVPERRSQWNP